MRFTARLPVLVLHATRTPLTLRLATRLVMYVVLFCFDELANKLSF